MWYPNIDKEQTAKRIKSFMRCNHLNPIDIKDYLGLTCVQAVYRWLSGINIPSIDNLYALSQLLGVRVDDMLAGDRKMRPLSLTCQDYLRMIIYYEKLKE